MNFATILKDKKEFSGIVKEDQFFSFDDMFGGNGPKTLIDFIKAYEGKDFPNFDQLISDSNVIPMLLTDVTLLSPITNPTRDVICIGKNYADHAVEVAETMQQGQGLSVIPTYGPYFAKSAYPPSAHMEDLPTHAELTSHLDYEAELAVIIGKTAKNVAKEDVGEYIFGYSVANDVTVRDRQINHNQWFFGKSFDQTCPIGPFIVSSEEIAYPPVLDITCHVNGELRQSSNTELFIFDIGDIVSELTKGMTLRPGDIILTGTPAGVGHAMNPPVYLKHGDVVDIYIEKVGTLTNKFV